MAIESINVEGVKLRLYRSGDGPAFLYLHSGFGELGPLPFLELIKEAGYSVRAPEMPGFGRSEAVRSWHKIEDAVYFYGKILDAVCAEPAVVAGQSLGGWLAAELAVWFPEKVRALVLMDAVGLWIEGHPIAELFGTNPVELMPKVFPSGGNILEHIAPALEGAVDSDAVLMHFFRAMETTAYLGWSPYMHDPNLEGRLSSVRAPTLVIHGTADGIVPKAHAERYAQRIPAARLVTVEGAGHLPALERPHDVASAVLTFLHDSGASPAHKSGSAPEHSSESSPRGSPKTSESTRVTLTEPEYTQRALESQGIPSSLSSLNIFRALAQFPLLAEVTTAPTAPLMTKGKLAPRLREAVILRTAWLNACAYEWAQHYKIATALGLGPETVRSLKADEARGQDPGLDAVVELTDALFNGSVVDDELFERCVRALGGVEQVLEAAAVAGAWTLVAYVLKAAAVPLEEGTDPWLPDGRAPSTASTAAPTP